MASEIVIFRARGAALDLAAFDPFTISRDVCAKLVSRVYQAHNYPSVAGTMERREEEREWQHGLQPEGPPVQINHDYNCGGDAKVKVPDEALLKEQAAHAKEKAAHAATKAKLRAVEASRVKLFEDKNKAKASAKKARHANQMLLASLSRATDDIMAYDEAMETLTVQLKGDHDAVVDEVRAEFEQRIARRDLVADATRIELEGARAEVASLYAALRDKDQASAARERDIAALMREHENELHLVRMGLLYERSLKETLQRKLDAYTKHASTSTSS